MPIQARRVFRTSLTVALALAVAFALGKPLPFLAPLFAVFFTAAPKPPMGLKGLLGLAVLVTGTLGIGLLLIPLLRYYTLSGVLIVAAGLYFSTYISVNLHKGAVGTFLTMGMTLIPLAGMIDFSVAVGVITALLVGISTAVVCQWIVYPFFPEESVAVLPIGAAVDEEEPSDWIALRTALIVLPPFLLALTNPGAYLAMIMKAVSLGKQASIIDMRNAGKELLGSTFMGGCFAVLFWFGLDLATNLWMFFLLMLLFGIFASSRMYRVFPSKYPPSFWVNVLVTMLILLGTTVQNSAGGKDVYLAFAVRMALFVGVSLYAWIAVVGLERWRTSRLERAGSFSPDKELPASL